MSINGEVAFDVGQVSVAQVNQLKASQLSSQLQIALAPLFHLSVGTTRILVGPKFGITRSWSSIPVSLNPGTTIDFDSDSYDWLLGGNLGALRAINKRVAVGGFLNLDYQDLISCSLTPTTQQPSGAIQAGTCTTSGAGAMISATAALAF